MVGSLIKEQPAWIRQDEQECLSWQFCCVSMRNIMADSTQQVAYYLTNQIYHSSYTRYYSKWHHCKQLSGDVLMSKAECWRFLAWRWGEWGVGIPSVQTSPNTGSLKTRVSLQKSLWSSIRDNQWSYNFYRELYLSRPLSKVFARREC